MSCAAQNCAACRCLRVAARRDLRPAERRVVAPAVLHHATLLAEDAAVATDTRLDVEVDRQTDLWLGCTVPVPDEPAFELHVGGDEVDEKVWPDHENKKTSGVAQVLPGRQKSGSCAPDAQQHTSRAERRAYGHTTSVASILTSCRR